MANSIYAQPPTFMQLVLRSIMQISYSSLLRINVAGEKNIPERGPLILVGNHRGTMDAALVGKHLPAEAWYVGPSDFKLLFPANVILNASRTIQVKRSAGLEMESVKRMIEALNAGVMLLMFPEGGTWEKPLHEAKDGAAYVSMMTQAPILPVGIGGTYRNWGDLFRLRRPVVSVKFGEIMPPVPQVPRAERSATLSAATQAIMERIYRLLPGPDQRWYDAQASATYDLFVEVWRGHTPTMIDLPGREALGELLLKPNLINPFAGNAGLPIDPFMNPGWRFTSASVKLAARSMLNCKAPALKPYIDYRLGPARSAALIDALNALVALAETPGVTGIVLKPVRR